MVLKAKPRRMRKLKVTHVSLTRRGKNKLRATFKGLEGDDEVKLAIATVSNDRCKQMLEEEGILTSIVYAPEHVDTDNDVASKEVIKDAAHNWLARGGHLDLDHNLEPLGVDRARLAETFIVHKGHPDFTDVKDVDGNPVDAEGAWAIRIKLIDESLKLMARSGEIGAVSLYGLVRYEQDGGKAASPDDAFADLLRKQSDKDEDDMNADEMKKALEANNVSLAKAITDGVAAVLTKQSPSEGTGTPPRKVEFKGDPKDSVALRKHYEALRFAAIDMQDPEAVKALLEELETEKAEKPEKKSTKDTAEVAELRRKLAASEGRSKVTKKADDGDGNEETQDEREENVEKAKSALRALYGIKEKVA